METVGVIVIIAVLYVVFLLVKKAFGKKSTPASMDADHDMGSDYGDGE
jgi:hypothetical protein